MWTPRSSPAVVLAALFPLVAGCGGPDADRAAGAADEAVLPASRDAAGDAGSEASGRNRVNMVTPNIVGEGGSAVINVVRYGPTESPLTVHYEVTGTATPGVDYVALSGEVVIPAGADRTDITLTALDNGVVENGDKVTFRIKPDPAYEILVDQPMSVLIVDKGARGEY